jgi:hydroxyethylthiazole kinase-like uncharacterized protein yjeF
MELLTAAQMRRLEQTAIASGQMTGLELMERAGQGVVAAVLAEWPELALAPQRALVLCGPGNNGGDGGVVARLLLGRGWDVEVMLYGVLDLLPPDAVVNCRRWCEVADLTVRTAEAVPGQDDSPSYPPPSTVLIDAAFGIGLARPLRGELARFADPAFQDALRARTVRRVAIDMASGVCADSGRIIGQSALPADLTVTFHRPKLGHVIGSGPQLHGKLRVVDIGLAPAPAVDQDVPTVRALGAPGRLLTRVDGHKYSHGHALVLSGPATRTGAARLAARGALRIGAGLVTVGAPADALAECAAHLTAIMLRQVGQGADLTAALGDRRINALCLGPGLGLDARAEGLVTAALQLGGDPVPGLSRDLTQAEAPRLGRGPGSSPGRVTCVLDADALTILARRPDLMAALHPGCILTPHSGEFSRLFPVIAAKLTASASHGPAFSRVDATCEAAAHAGCVVLSKGPDTIIADPAGRVSVNASVYDRAAPWLATAGSGDVLAGFITGLLARGLPPVQAAETAAWLHTECALSFGPGLIAEDLPEQLPAVFRELDC